MLGLGHHGKSPWTIPRFFSQTIEFQIDLGIHPLEFEYVLIDLSQIPDQLLRERLELELALTLFRHSRDEDFFSALTQILPLMAELRRKETGLEYIETILRYVYYVRSGDEWEGFIDLLHQMDPIIEEIAMTTMAERHLQEGKISEAHDVLLELLEEQFGVLPSRTIERLRQVQNHWVLRMLRRQRRTCRSLEEFELLVEKALQ